MTEKEYQQMNREICPVSPAGRDLPLAFVVGGTVCVLGQVVWSWLEAQGVEPSTASALASISLIALSALLTGLNVYDDIARYAGAGTLVPITGFANSMVSPAMEFKTEGYILGLGAKMFSIAGPVLVYGISTSVGYGVLYYLWTVNR